MAVAEGDDLVGPSGVRSRQFNFSETPRSSARFDDQLCAFCHLWDSTLQRPRLVDLRAAASVNITAATFVDSFPAANEMTNSFSNVFHRPTVTFVICRPKGLRVFLQNKRNRFFFFGGGGSKLLCILRV